MQAPVVNTMIPDAASRYGDACAIVFESRSVTFNQLEILTNRVASGLAASGLVAGDRLVLYGENSLDWILAYHGAMKAGAIVIPANSMLTGKELAFVIENSAARFLVASPDKAAAVTDDLAAIRLDGRFVTEAGEVDGWVPMDTVMKDGADAFQPVARDPSDTASIAYTSGTTGHPKGAMQSHRAVWLNTAVTATMHMKTPGEVVVSALPCPHVYGNVVFNGAIMCGMTLVLMRRFEPAAALDLIERHGATLFEGVPTMYYYMLQQPDHAERDLSSLSRCTVGGQTMPPVKMAEVERAFGCPLIELWGMTEISGLGTTFPALGERRHGSVGVALPYCETRIDSLENPGTAAGPDVAGELLIRGPIVMQGYYGNEAATRDTIDADGWLHTGDVAVKDADGFITIVDRKKDMILTAGYNVYPAEVERVLAGHASVAMVAVGGLPDAEKGEIACAYVVLASGCDLDADELIAFARGELAAYKVPRKVEFLDDLPKTSSGKIQRRLLADYLRTARAELRG